MVFYASGYWYGIAFALLGIRIFGHSPVRIERISEKLE